MTDPQNLSKSGIKFWNSLTDWQKDSPYYLDYHLCGSHFESWDDYETFKKECKISPWRTRLLENVSSPENIDEQFLNNLCNILADMNEKLEDLENGKVDRDW